MQDIHYLFDVVLAVVAMVLTDTLKVERWSDGKKSALAFGVSVVIALSGMALTGRIHLEPGLLANIGVVLTHSAYVFTQIANRLHISDFYRENILGQMGWWRDRFLQPPAIPDAPI